MDDELVRPRLTRRQAVLTRELGRLMGAERATTWLEDLLVLGKCWLRLTQSLEELPEDRAFVLRLVAEQAWLAAQKLDPRNPRVPPVPPPAPTPRGFFARLRSRAHR